MLFNNNIKHMKTKTANTRVKFTTGARVRLKANRIIGGLRQFAKQNGTVMERRTYENSNNTCYQVRFGKVTRVIESHRLTNAR